MPEFGETPYRTPLSVMYDVKEYIENKKFMDLGCGCGHLLLFLYLNFNCTKLKGITEDQTKTKRGGNHVWQPNKNIGNKNLNIQYGDIKQYNFEICDMDTYYIWIEKPQLEIDIIKTIKSYNYEFKKTLIISYNTNTRCKCSKCRAYLSYLHPKFNNLLKWLDSEQIIYKIKTSTYDEGIKCRQAGQWSLIIITF